MSDYHDPVTMTFDVHQGAWHVTKDDEGYWSTGLERALAHAGAVFGVARQDVTILVQPHLDQLALTARTGAEPQAEQARRDAVRFVHQNEIPLGKHDLCVLLRCDEQLIDELFNQSTQAP